MHNINLTTHFIGYFSLGIFVFAYLIVMIEEFTHLRKSKPVIISAALIWAFIAFFYTGISDGHSNELEKALEKEGLFDAIICYTEK